MHLVGLVRRWTDSVLRLHRRSHPRVAGYPQLPVSGCILPACAQRQAHHVLAMAALASQQDHPGVCASFSSCVWACPCGMPLSPRLALESVLMQCSENPSFLFSAAISCLFLKSGHRRRKLCLRWLCFYCGVHVRCMTVCVSMAKKAPVSSLS